MTSPVGEANWLAYLEEAVRNATDLERRVNALEHHKRAVTAEPGSLRLWLAYCNYFWSLWSAGQVGGAGEEWPQEERLLARELFTFNAALELWQQGYETIKYRLDDSHLLWDRWVSLEMELLAKARAPEGVKRITHLFRNRLTTPHMTWDDTSQRYSSFLSEYNRSVWEESMKEVTTLAQEAKRLITTREPWELKLSSAARDNNVERQKTLLTDYLDWEIMQSRRNNDKPEIGMDLCRGLFARALTGIFSTDENAWHDYIVYMSSSHSNPQTPESLLDVLRRAVQHCPWSGLLWHRYIICAEEAKLAFADLEAIKHAATSDDQLYKNGMESMIEMYMAWCGFLKRNAMIARARDEAIDVADVGLIAALEDVAVVGQRLYGKDFQGDPKFRLERILIQYLTEKKGSVDEARAQWDRLASVQMHADSYEFWSRYYMWEMCIFAGGSNYNRSPTPNSNPVGLRTPSAATAVLTRATRRRTLDWPERALDAYLQHCNDYEPPAVVRNATDSVHKLEKTVRKRRVREEEQKAAAYAAYYEAQQTQGSSVNETEADISIGDADDASLNGTKRKREVVKDVDLDGDKARKRAKGDDAKLGSDENTHNAQAAGRDRENTTVVVENLPLDVTQTKVRQYFKEYGHINNITALVSHPKSQSSTALIEFRSSEEARSALLRNGKYFGQMQLEVQSGYDLTVYVANYPPTADEQFIRDLFKDCGEILSVRWPSLKVNTHRRFCYVSFRHRDGSSAAVKKDGALLDDRYKLLAKYSDPGRKKPREGAVAEGREVQVTNLDRMVTEEELRDIFSKSGTITRVNMPLAMSGKNRGIAYMDFQSKEEAEQVVRDLNNVKLRNAILKVDVTAESKVKPSAKIINRSSASPAPSLPDSNNNDGQSGGKVDPAEIASRTIALMGLPDTVNDARVKALLEPLGTVVQLVLQPSHGGAKIEFADASTAGRASLQINNMQFDGQQLRVGTLEELRHAKVNHQEDRISYGSKGSNSKADKTSAASRLIPQHNIKRPIVGRPKPMNSGMGKNTKEPLAKNDYEPAKNDLAKPMGEHGLASKEPKGNADFRAMFLGSVKNAPEKKIDQQRISEEKEANGV